MNKQSIAIGSDHAGYDLKQVIIDLLEKEGYDFKDFGCFDCEKIDYPIISKKVAHAVADGEFQKGIIVCGSGLGVAIAANKVKGIRAVTCSEAYSAKMSRAHNDANILTMGGRVIGSDVACEVVKTWLTTEFEGGRHKKRVDMIEE